MSTMVDPPGLLILSSCEDLQRRLGPLQHAYESGHRLCSHPQDFFQELDQTASSPFILIDSFFGPQGLDLQTLIQKIQQKRPQATLALRGHPSGELDGDYKVFELDCDHSALLAWCAPRSDQSSSTQEKKFSSDDFDFSDLIPRFLKNREQDLKILQQLLNQSQFKLMADKCHSIKGVAPLYGFETLGALARSLEQAALSGNESDCGRFIALMEQDLQRHGVPSPL